MCVCVLRVVGPDVYTLDTCRDTTGYAKVKLPGREMLICILFRGGTFLQMYHPNQRQRPGSIEAVVMLKEIHVYDDNIMVYVRLVFWF